MSILDGIFPPEQQLLDHIHSVLTLDVMSEAERSIELHGIQELPDGTGHRYRWQRDDLRAATARAAQNGSVSWRHVLLEEVYEALAEVDEDDLRTELIQVINVAAKWVADLDRRRRVRVEETPKLSEISGQVKFPILAGSVFVSGPSDLVLMNA